jgi:hypothetical protein
MIVRLPGITFHPPALNNSSPVFAGSHSPKAMRATLLDPVGLQAVAAK